ncbi:MAG TPA: methyl-accepting chemotaxis protein, partial [Chloroflexota bacterium]|nr:methyl-accepting chemotaxis protein [Chloroflexota bacterium]
TGLYLYNTSLSFVSGDVARPASSAAGPRGAICDPTGYCAITTGPLTGYFATSAYHANLSHALTSNGSPLAVLTFGTQDGPFGSLLVFQPVTVGGTTKPVGVLVGQIDAATIFNSYIRQGDSGNLILDGPIVLGPDTMRYHRGGQLPVTTTAGLDPSISGGLKPVRIGAALNGDSPVFTLGTTTEQGSRARIGTTGLAVLNYAPPGALSASAAHLLAGALVFFLLLIATIIGLVFYLNYRLRRDAKERTQVVRAKSEALTEDIVAVSQALSVAREGDLTVQVPDSESEVGLLSLSLNGLISDYGQIVGGIIRASQAVQEGAARVDQGVRRIVEVATSQTESVAAVATSVEDVAASAVEVQQETTMATTLAANAHVAVQSGQESVGRIADAVDAIKQAAIGTTREFKRLQEDSIRLTALVSSVKSNAENLDMQAANATLEARHLGTESGSTFAANIGRLARQAQDTLADAEGAVRSVVASIDEVNRRIERISEQVRHGVEEVRTVRSTFDQITKTNTSLVQFIDGVAESAGIQAQSAQQAAYSISEIAQIFEQFTELLITSGDEIANMRLIVAGLRESVADLRVGQHAAIGEALGTESAA